MGKIPPIFIVFFEYMKFGICCCFIMFIASLFSLITNINSNKLK